MRSAVVLPAPFRPRKPTVSPSSISNETGPSARLAPKYFETFSARIISVASSKGFGGPAAPGGPRAVGQRYQPVLRCQGFPPGPEIEASGGVPGGSEGERQRGRAA